MFFLHKTIEASCFESAQEKVCDSRLGEDGEFEGPTQITFLESTVPIGGFPFICNSCLTRDPGSAYVSESENGRCGNCGEQNWIKRSSDTESKIKPYQGPTTAPGSLRVYLFYNSEQSEIYVFLAKSVEEAKRLLAKRMRGDDGEDEAAVNHWLTRYAKFYKLLTEEDLTEPGFILRASIDRSEGYELADSDAVVF